MKKVLSVMIAAAMISFVACKGKAAEPEVAPTDSPVVEQPVVIDTAAENAAKEMVADTTMPADTTKPAEGAKEGEKHEEHK